MLTDHEKLFLATRSKKQILSIFNFDAEIMMFIAVNDIKLKVMGPDNRHAKGSDTRIYSNISDQ